MSTAARPTIAQLTQSTAQQLLTVSQQTISEEIFADAVAHVQREIESPNVRRSSKKIAADKALLSDIASVRDIAQVAGIVERKIDSSMIWGRTAKIRPDGKFQRVVSTMLHHKSLLDSIVPVADPTVAAPVWGAICFLLTTAQQVPKIQEVMKQVQDLARKHLKAFSEYFMDPKEPAPEKGSTLREALQDFYVTLISGAINVSPLLTSTSRGLIDISTGSAVRLVSDLKTDLSNKMTLVWHCGSAHKAKETRDDLKMIKAGHSYSNAASGSTQTHPMRIRHMLSPRFAGRDNTLLAMSSRLACACPNGAPSKIALCGMPGIGKTQTAIAYANSKLVGHQYVHTMFIRANDKSSLQTDLLELAQRALVAQYGTLGTDATIQRFQTWLETAEKWLLVVDNVTDTTLVMSLAPANGNGHIIYTTRSSETAKLLCGSQNVVEVDRMTDAESREMLQAMFLDRPITATSQADQDEEIWRVTAFCRGLPLVMEQVVNNATYRKISWTAELARVKHKRGLLMQKSINGFHFDDRQDEHSAGAVLISGIEALRDYDQSMMAYMLLFVLAYLEPSSIPVNMLIQGAGQLDSWFNRQVTFDRGSKRTYQGNELVSHAQIHRASPYIPAAPRKLDVRRLAASVLRNSTGARVEVLDRLDTEPEDNLRRWWNESEALRQVLSSTANMHAAVNAVIDTGLVKRTTNTTLRIHDVYAELATAYLEASLDRPQASSNLSPAVLTSNMTAHQTMHLSATLVYLAFPPIIARNFTSTSSALSLLPHAQATLRHLTEADLLADTIVGAELSHIAGCATDLMVLRTRIEGEHRRRQVVGNASLDKERAEASLPFFRQAHSCYAKAAERLVKRELDAVSAYQYALSPTRRTRWEVVRRKIARAVQDDYALEEIAQAQRQDGEEWMRYGNNRHAGECERFGSDPVRRRLDSLLKLGVMCKIAGRGEESVRYLKGALGGYEWLLGERHALSEKARELLQVVLMEMGRWKEALRVIGRRYLTLEASEDMNVKRRRWWTKNEQVEDGVGLVEKVAAAFPDLVDKGALCLVELGHFREALLLFELLYRRGERCFGYSKLNIPAARSIAVICGRAEEWERCVFWWCVVFGLVFGADDADLVVKADVSEGGNDEEFLAGGTLTGLSILNEEGWWLKDAYDGSIDLNEECQMWDYAVKKWRTRSECLPQDGPRTSLGMLVSKTEVDLAAWRRRSADRKARRRAKECSEIEDVMIEWRERAEAAATWDRISEGDGDR